MQRIFLCLILLMLVISCKKQMESQELKISELELQSISYQDIKLVKGDNRLFLDRNDVIGVISNAKSVFHNESSDIWTLNNESLSILVVNSHTQEVKVITRVNNFSIIQNEGLLAIVTNESENRYEQKIIVYNIETMKNIFSTNVNHKRNNSNKTSTRLQEFNFLSCDISYLADEKTILINWKQADYLFQQVRFFLPTKGFDFKTMNIEKTTEYTPLSNNSILFSSDEKTELSDKGIVLGVTTFNNNHKMWLVAKKKGFSYSDVSFLATEENDSIVHEINLSEVFPYQDVLLDIILANSEKDSACYIIYTKEFSYDFTITPSYEINIRLRPSSFTTRYIK